MVLRCHFLLRTIRSSLRDLESLRLQPGVETPGYCHPSLRDRRRRPKCSARRLFLHSRAAGTAKTACFWHFRAVLMKKRLPPTVPGIPRIIFRFPGMIPGTRRIIFRTRRMIPGTPQIIPRTPGTVPGTRRIIPRTPGMVSGTLIIIPGTRGTIFRTRKIIPGTVKFIPRTPKMVPGSRKTSSRTLKLPSLTR
jgi:hypothetical protein